jgi:hypothetical protein
MLAPPQLSGGSLSQMDLKGQGHKRYYMSVFWIFLLFLYKKQFSAQYLKKFATDFKIIIFFF